MTTHLRQFLDMVRLFGSLFSTVISIIHNFRPGIPAIVAIVVTVVVATVIEQRLCRLFVVYVFDEERCDVSGSSVVASSEVLYIRMKY